MFTATEPAFRDEPDQDSSDLPLLPSDPWETEWEPPKRDELADKHARARERERILARGAPPRLRPDSGVARERLPRPSTKADPAEQPQDRSNPVSSAG